MSDRLVGARRFHGLIFGAEEKTLLGRHYGISAAILRKWRVFRESERLATRGSWDTFINSESVRLQFLCPPTPVLDPADQAVSARIGTNGIVAHDGRGKPVPNRIQNLLLDFSSRSI